MPVKQKPEYDVVKRAAVLEKDPQSATLIDVKRMASRIMNDEKNAPQPNRIVPKPAPKATARSRAQLLYPTHRR
jgi:hypothetical protein